MKQNDDTPDSVVPNPHSLPYPTNIGAPVIRPEQGLAGWKHGAVHGANKHYQDRFDDLKRQFELLAEEFKWNDMMFNAEFKLKPVVGQIYHLYNKQNDSKYKHYISLFAPEERVGGHDNYVGSFKLNYDNRWEKI